MRRTRPSTPWATPFSRYADYGSCLPLQLQRLHGLRDDRIPYQIIRGFPDEDLARLCGLLQASRDVDRVAGRDRLVAGTGDDRAGVHTDPDGDRDAAIALELLVQDGECFLHLRRGADRAQRVVLVDVRHAEQRHHRVADELLHRSAMALDHGPHVTEVPTHRVPQGLRVQAFAERGGARDIAEDDRDRLADLVDMLRGKRGRARHAELRFVGIDLSAVRADRHDRSLGLGSDAREEPWSSFQLVPVTLRRCVACSGG